MPETGEETMSNSLLARVPMPAKLGAALGTAVLAAACGSTGGGGSQASTPAASGSAMVIKTSSGAAGQFLTDGSGRAVYLWMKDGKNQSACSGACTGVWPPVMTNGTVTASGGAVASDLGTITRSDGGTQVTYDGHPLYYYTGDTGAGQQNGQGNDGFGAKWWIVAPSGASITSSVTNSGGGGGGYGAPASSPSASKAGGGWS